MTTPTALPTPPAKRPYVRPALVTHGDVQTLTQAKSGIQFDLDSAGSFVPPSESTSDGG